MLILGIDTSCDDTCIAILEIKKQPFGESASRPGKLEIKSNIVSSQEKLHAKYGGVWPSLAKREHKKNLPIVFKKAIKGINLSKIDLIGVTVGPGLEPCLWEGVNFAKELAKNLNKSIVPVNHIEAHILINWLNFGEIPMPAVCLVVSGGHTVLFLMKGIGNYKLIGETRDDAAGECFDKAARILGLSYPGGPIIDELASQFKKSKFKIKLPRPMIYHKNYDFSFSGLKTAVLYKVKGERLKVKDKRYIREMCREVQQSIIDVLIAKTIRAAKNYRAKSVILGGGVAASEELRCQFKKRIDKELKRVNFLVPLPEFCRDNAVMAALTVFLNQNKIKKPAEIKADANLKI